MFDNRKTIHNAKAMRRRVKLNGRTPIQALVNEVGSDNIHRKINLSTDGRVKRLFFAHVDSAALSNHFSSLLWLDCTYKTNRFRMPLLHFVGRTNLSTIFSIGCAFLSEEVVLIICRPSRRLESCMSMAHFRLW